MRILILLLLFQISVFAADFHTHIRISTGVNMTFSTAEHSLIIVLGRILAVLE